MSSEVYKIFTRKYQRLKNKGMMNVSYVTAWEYQWANLTFPDGYRPGPEDFKPVNRRGKVLNISYFPYLAEF